MAIVANGSQPFRWWQGEVYIDDAAKARNANSGTVKWHEKYFLIGFFLKNQFDGEALHAVSSALHTLCFSENPGLKIMRISTNRTSQISLTRRSRDGFGAARSDGL